VNWFEIVTSLLSFIIFLFFLATLLYFVQYQMQKRQRLKARFVHPLEGRFLQRYIPLELRAKYDEQIAAQKGEIQMKARRWWFQGSAVLALLAIGGGLAGAPERALAEQPQLGSWLELDDTSDDIQKTSYGASYRNHRRDPLWPYEAEEPRALDWGVAVESHTGTMADDTDFKGVRFGGLLGYKHSHRVHGELGFFLHRLDAKDHDVDTTRLAGQGRLTLHPHEKLFAVLSARNDFVYPEMYLPAGVARGLTATTARLDLIYRPHEKWRCLGRTSQKWFSDGNRREEHDAAAMYGIMPTSPWIWAGVGVNYLGYDFGQAGLWTPHRFFAYGPRLDTAVPVGAGITAIGEFNFNFAQEEDMNKTEGYSTAAGLRFGDRNRTEINALYRRIETDLHGVGWSSKGATVTVSHSF
jgi:hypothetical protein